MSTSGSPPRPGRPPAPDIDKIPVELKMLRQWVLWRYELRDDKWTKIPYQPSKTGAKAKADDSTTWGSFDLAWEAYHKGGFDGIGFEFSGSDEFFGVDIDKCLSESGEVLEWAAAILTKLETTYGEISPSGRGVKFIARGKLPGATGTRRNGMGEGAGALELYDHGRFFTMTGDSFGTGFVLNDLQEAADSLYALAKERPKSKAETNDHADTFLATVTGENLEARVVAYLATCEPAISGQGGHDKTFGVACRIGPGFNLTEDEAFGYLRDYFNPRCEPPWEERDLRRKVSEGFKRESRRGWLLDSGKQSSRRSSSAGAAAAQAVNGQSNSSLPEIIITPRRQEVAESTLATLGNDPDLYCRGGSLGIVIEEIDSTVKLSSGVEFRNAKGSVRFMILSRPRIGCMLTRNARFFRERTDKKGDPFLAEVDPPEWLPGAVETWGYWPGVRRVLSLTSCPFVRADGSIMQPGYDGETGALYRPVGLIGDVPEQPTQSDVAQANLRLFRLVEQFPFRLIQEKSDTYAVEDYDYAVWLAYTLTLVQRPSIAGPVPGFAFDANRAGSGKGMLIDAGGIIATGGAIPTRSYPADPAEFSKVKLAIALAGIPVVHFDNLPEGGFFGSGELDSALTSTETSGRILGASRDSGPVPLRPVWALSGNNTSPTKDAYRRWLPCRLETKLESPHEREDLRIADLKGHVQANRPALLAAALTLLRAHALAGRPVNWKSPLGSFEQWDRIVRGAVWFATGRDCLTTQRLATQESPERLEKIGLLKGWSELPDGTTTGHTVAEGVRYAVDDPLKHPALAAMLPAFTGKNAKPDAVAIGRKFRAMKGQHIDGMVLETGDSASGGVLRWRVRTA